MNNCYNCSFFCSEKLQKKNEQLLQLFIFLFRKIEKTCHTCPNPALHSPHMGKKKLLMQMVLAFWKSASPDFYIFLIFSLLPCFFFFFFQCAGGPCVVEVSVPSLLYFSHFLITPLFFFFFFQCAGGPCVVEVSVPSLDGSKRQETRFLHGIYIRIHTYVYTHMHTHTCIHLYM